MQLFIWLLISIVLMFAGFYRMKQVHRDHKVVNSKKAVSFFLTLVRFLLDASTPMGSGYWAIVAFIIGFLMTAGLVVGCLLTLIHNIFGS